jgi:uncharacterized membrane protein YkvI
MIFSTTVPLVWTVASRIAPEKSKLYYISIACMIVLGFFGGQIPFAKLINYFYPTIGYVGMILFVMLCWFYIRKYRDYLKAKTGTSLPESKE